MARLIKIDKKLYAVGLNWHTFSDKKQLPNKASESFDAYALNRSSKQFGLALTYRNERFLFAQTLAAMLTILDTSYIGVFTLKDIEEKEFYWIYAVNKGQILGFGDNICKDKNEVENTLATLKEFSSVFPEPVYFSDIEESEKFIKNNLSKTRYFNLYKIHALYRSKKQTAEIKKFIFVCILAFGALFGLLQYLDVKNLEELRAAALFSKQTTENKIKNIYANTHKYFPMEWKKNNYPLNLYETCKPVLFALPINEFGWSLEKAICTPKEITSYWKHEKQASFIDLPFDGTLSKPKEVKAKHEIQEIKLVQKDIEHTKLLSQEEGSKILYQLTQNMGANLSLSFEKSQVKEFKDLKISITAPFKKGKFKWKSVPSSLMLNDSLFEALNAIPSLSINSIEYSNGQWSVTGELYVKS